jgi:metal-dependent amidase/aminoacylase/carboxypeptidase family protein
VFRMTRHLPVTSNDKAPVQTLEGSFRAHFGEAYDSDIPPTTISEDVSVLASSVGKPCVFWHWGGIEAGEWDEKLAQGKVESIPANHTARFAPAVQPTLRTGVEALVVAALAFFEGKMQSKL